MLLLALRKCWSFIVFLITVSSAETFFKDFPTVVFQNHLAVSRHLPLCVIYREYGVGSPLEKALYKLWKSNKNEQLTHWQFGSYAVDKAGANPQVPIVNANLVPRLRCFLGKSSYYDFGKNSTRKSLRTWFKKLVLRHEKQLQDATLRDVERSSRQNNVTFVAFLQDYRHNEIENLLSEVENNWGADYSIGTFIAHHHSRDIRQLIDLYNVVTFPSVAIISQNDETVETLEDQDVTADRIETSLWLQLLQMKHLNTEDFELSVMDLTRHYTPWLVFFYSTHESCANHLRALYHLRDEVRERKINLKIGLVNVDKEDSDEIIDQFIDHRLTNHWPFTIIFNTKYKKTKVIGISQYLVTEPPTTSTVFKTLTKYNIPLGANAILSNIQLQSGLNEGPYGTQCSVTASNVTENDPIVEIRSKIKKKRVKRKSWHDDFDSDVMDATLHHVNGLALLDENSWSRVIEQSHAPQHPLYRGQHWRGEASKVALVVFIIADCSSCTKGMETYISLKKSVRYTDGGSLYLVNCTQSALLCNRLKVNGFPSVAAFRGLGWLHGSQCARANRAPSHVRTDYHGVIKASEIMTWFSAASAEAVQNVRFGEAVEDDMRLPFRVVGTLVPKDSNYLPHSTKGSANWFPFNCFRLACEQLFGQGECRVRFSDEIPEREFEDETREMIITEVKMYRKDGFSSTIARLGDFLDEIMDEEESNNKQQLHKSHRYHIPPRAKCEDDHVLCTELIVAFCRDHGRTAVTHLTEESFHNPNSVLFAENLPILIALARPDNLTEKAKFYKTLEAVALELYQEIVVTSVNVEDFPAWAAAFAPKNTAPVPTGQSSPQHQYPRLVLIRWTDHNHAAFYPSFNTRNIHSFRFMRHAITSFVRNFLRHPDKYLQETEHF